MDHDSYEDPLEKYFRLQAVGKTPNWNPKQVPRALEMLALIEASKHPCKSCGAKECGSPQGLCFTCLSALCFFPNPSDA